VQICCKLLVVLKKIGAHVSAAGGVSNSIANAKKIGADAFALFLKNQRSWGEKPLTNNEVVRFIEERKKNNFSPNSILPHGSYLMNIGSPDDELYEKSKKSFLDEMKRCEQLEIIKFNFHPGSSRGQISTVASCTKIAAAINWVHTQTKTVITVLENTAGGGSTIGRTFEELKIIIDKIEDKSRVGVCLDTCHLFASGYDITTKPGYEKTMKEFDSIIGFSYLMGVHVNDSKEKLNSKKDRHANIGKGEIGLEPFKWLMRDPRLDNAPFILETPSEGNDYAKEVALLRSFNTSLDT